MGKKEELLINVAKIINEEGMQKLTIEHVANKSGLTKGGVLYHFESKEQLILKMNEMAIAQHEANIAHFKKQLTGAYQFTRAYAMATLEVLNKPEDVLLPAVFISSQENKKSEQLWVRISEKWNESFHEDEGDLSKILELRMICDGVWFSMMYQHGEDLKEEMKEIIERSCERLKREDF